MKQPPHEYCKDLVKHLDRKIEEVQRAGESDNERRRHLGASVVGVECPRERWYTFRWASKVTFSGRMLRLFDRGHKEEHRFVEWFDLMGAEFQPYDPATYQTLWVDDETGEYVKIIGDPTLEDCARMTNVDGDLLHEIRAGQRGITLEPPKQFGFRTHDGHFAGRCDGRVRNLPGIEKVGIDSDTWIMTEFKTHNAASFTNLVSKGMAESKPVHLIQAKTYMHYIGFPATLYCGVNKNDDELQFELVMADPAYVEKMTPHVLETIHIKKPPPRISNSPSWYKCQWCDHRLPCHFGHALEKNCRTCVSSRPVQDGNWHCDRWQKDIPHSAEEVGCDAWKQIDD